MDAMPILDWILKQENDFNGNIGEILVRAIDYKYKC